LKIGIEINEQISLIKVIKFLKNYSTLFLFTIVLFAHHIHVTQK
jgi:hypothetical protein